MWLLFLLFLGWLLGKLWQRLQAWRSRRKLVRQLKELGCYGGTVKIGKMSKRPEKPVELSVEPDGPAPFGYKTCWTAIRCEDPERVIAALGPQSGQSANWETGIQAVYAGQGCFVTPCLDGFVLVIGADVSLEQRKALRTEVQMFHSHRVCSSYGWLKWADGKTVRAYSWEEDYVTADTGPLTPEELALGFDRFPRAGQEDCENVPDEEDVLDIAAAWGVDPRFEKKTYPPSTGWLCAL